MNKVKPIFRYIFSARFATHLLMIAFAGASLGNIKSFFMLLHADIQVAWGIGIAVGGSLVVMAALLSEMTWNTKDQRFQVVSAVTLALCLLSGFIQTWAYNQHMWGLYAGLLGFALPLVGELGLSFALSAYNKAMTNRRVEEAQSKLANGVRDMISEAVESIDRSKVQAQVDRATNVIVRAVVDNVVSSMIAELQSNETILGSEVETKPAVTSGTINNDNPNNDTNANDDNELETLKAIVRYYLASPGATYQQAANELALEKMAIHRRVKRLVKDKVLHEEKKGKRSIITVNGRHEEFLAQ